MYHSVADHTTEGFREYTVTPSRLAEHLAALKTAGWRAVGVTEALAQLSADAHDTGHRVVALTFDDGLADFHAYALPVLCEASVRASLFVPTAYVGSTARWLQGADAYRPLLNWKALAEVVASDLEIGSHGHLHAPLDVGRSGEIYQDVARSKMQLEDVLGTAVTALAFPFGYQNSKSRRAAQHAGYHSACAVADMPATCRDPVFALPRLAATQNMTGEDVVTTVNRSYARWERPWRRGKQRVFGAARKTGLVGPRSLSSTRVAADAVITEEWRLL
jgi:peptidoglycan/xylan/chitin deacetylase (PgdA/CDA1 family)